MKSLAILEPNTTCLSKDDKSVLSIVSEHQKQGYISHSTAVSISTDPTALQQALACSINQGILINHSSSYPFEQALLLEPYIEDIDCIYISNKTGPHGHLGHILSGLLSWDIHTKPKPQSIILVSKSRDLTHPSIENILSIPAISIQNPKHHSYYKKPSTTPKKRLARLFSNKEVFIKALLEDGILQ